MPNDPTPSTEPQQPSPSRGDTVDSEGPASSSNGRGEVLAPDGVARDTRSAGETRSDSTDADSEQPGVESPAKIIRIGAMVKQLLEELRDTELDEPSRDRLRDIYDNSITELRSAMSDELAEELDHLSFAFGADELPSGVELRMAKAQLVGWLEGLFHGMQAALMAQQMNMRQQLEGMRQQIPESTGGQPRGGPGYL